MLMQIMYIEYVLSWYIKYWIVSSVTKSATNKKIMLDQMSTNLFSLDTRTFCPRGLILHFVTSSVLLCLLDSFHPLAKGVVTWFCDGTKMTFLFSFHRHKFIPDSICYRADIISPQRELVSYLLHVILCEFISHSLVALLSLRCSVTLLYCPCAARLWWQHNKLNSRRSLRISDIFHLVSFLSRLINSKT